MKAVVLSYALDCTLGSMKKVRPVISRAWGTVKEKVATTKANKLLNNFVVVALENKVGNLADLVMAKMKVLRDRQLVNEVKALEDRIQYIKQQMASGGGRGSGGCGQCGGERPDEPWSR